MAADAFSLFSQNREQEARVLEGCARMLPECLTDKIRSDLLDSVAAWMKDAGVSQSQLSRKLGCSASYVSHLLTGSEQIPPATRDELLRKCNALIEEDARGRDYRRPDGLVDTAVVKRFIQAARHVSRARTIGLAVGPAGIGKTIAAKAVAAEMPGAVLVSVTHDTRARRGFLDALARALRMRTARTCVRLADVVERLAGSGRLLMVDQAHDLRSDVLGLLHNLHDEAELPILLIGTVAIDERVRKDADPRYGQLSSRIGLRVPLLPELFGRGRGGRPAQWISSEEIRRMFSRGKLRLHPEAVRLLAEMANRDIGHLRRVRNVVRLAEIFARDASASELGVADLLKAVELVDGAPAGAPPPSSPDQREVLSA